MFGRELWLGVVCIIAVLPLQIVLTLEYDKASDAAQVAIDHHLDAGKRN